jgi:aspartyl-tRNA synthetase
MINLSKRITTLEVQKTRLGSEVVVAGFVEQTKLLGKMAFLKLRDREGYVQIVATSNYPKMKDLNTISRESVISIRGRVKKSKARSGGKELELIELNLLSRAATPLPIEFLGKNIETDLSKRLDYRYIDLRNPKNLLVMKVLSTFVNSSRQFFVDNDLIEIFSPKLIATPSEGGGEDFAIPYFKRKAYLAQSPQFYKQMANAAGMGGVFEIGPVFRANPSHTTRHDTEFTSLDVEVSWLDDEEIRKFEERWLTHSIRAIKNKHGNEIKSILDIDIRIPKLPFPRIKMENALKIAGINGDDLDPSGERKVYANIKRRYNHQFVFVTDFPWSIRPFYHMKSSENTTKSYDLLFRGVEITTGAQREHRYNILLEQAKEKGLKIKDIQFYLDFFKYGAPPHSGFGLSPTRVVMQLLELGNVREATFVPRDTERLTP